MFAGSAIYSTRSINMKIVLIIRAQLNKRGSLPPPLSLFNSFIPNFRNSSRNSNAQAVVTVVICGQLVTAVIYRERLQW